MVGGSTPWRVDGGCGLVAEQYAAAACPLRESRSSTQRPLEMLISREYFSFSHTAGVEKEVTGNRVTGADRALMHDPTGCAI
jgi:hypothetical protein